MSGLGVDAGELRERLEVLALRETDPGVWTWEPVRRTWGKVTVDGKRNLFSTVGIGARNAVLVMRKQELSLCGGLRWRGQHLFLTRITELDRTHLTVEAALVEVDTIALREDETVKAMTFPGILTEKYARHEQEWPMSINELGLVLVTPKRVVLRPGCLVEAREGAWEVLVPHELDPYKNEYEMGRRGDL